MLNTTSLAETPFGRRGARHMVTEQGGTLWLALASEAAPSLVPTAPRPAGLLEINIVKKDGKIVPYTYETNGLTITLKSAAGEAVITQDASINALRIKGGDFTLRLDGKMPAGVSSINKPNGTEINIGGGKYFFVAQKGTISFDDTWVVASFGSVTPVLDLAPDKYGEFELIAYELPADTVPPVVEKTFDEAVHATTEEYNEFFGSLKESLPAELKYKIWVNSRKLPNGHWCVTPNRLYSATATAVDEAIASLAFKGDAAIDVATSLPQASPPILGYVSKQYGYASDTARRVLKDELDAAKKWWDTNRHYPGGYYYAYRFETGLNNPEGFRDNGFFPDPDLQKLIAALSGEAAGDVDLAKYISGGLIAEIYAAVAKEGK
ncbi:MAG: hypothetical protein LBN00_00150 [Oscillospiraceae bacterium]|jgi:hypothetical protein|nr:hypothetical protein [Oscillospiraceae bacterium]